MVLGIKLEIDKKSVKAASKELGKAGPGGRGATGGRRARGGLGGAGALAGAVIGEQAEEKKGKKGSPFGGALIGGLIGSLIGALEPIRELLQVIGGILKIALVPILILMKPFLIVLLKMALKLMQWLKDPVIAFAEGFEEGGITGAFEGAADQIIEEQGKTTAGWLGTILTILGAAILAIIFIFGTIPLAIVAAVGFIIALLIAFWDDILFAFKAVWDSLVAAWDWLVEFFKKIGTWFLEAWNKIKLAWDSVLGWLKDLGKQMWETILSGLEFIADLGEKIWNWFKSALSSIADLGSLIWNWMKDALGSFFGGDGGATSLQDGLITSKGDIVKFHPNDNILAFQDFSTLAAQGNGNGGVTNIFNIEGSVWTEDDLGDVIGKALNNKGRGRTAQF